MSELHKRLAAGAIIAVAILVGGYMWWSNHEPADTLAGFVELMDSETGELVKERVTVDLKPYPHPNPKTGKATLYPYEVCYFGACETAGGTRVIRDEQLGKPGPTSCPKCGHKVVMFNPRPRDAGPVSQAGERESH